MAEDYRINARLGKLETDIYYGSGKDNPALTTRMALVEDIVGKINDNLKWFVRLTVASILTALASITVAIILFVVKVKT